MLQKTSLNTLEILESRQLCGGDSSLEVAAIEGAAALVVGITAGAAIGAAEGGPGGAAVGAAVAGGVLVGLFGLWAASQ